MCWERQVGLGSREEIIPDPANCLLALQYPLSGVTERHKSLVAQVNCGEGVRVGSTIIVKGCKHRP